jgi:hypothetical protein
MGTSLLPIKSPTKKLTTRYTCSVLLFEPDLIAVIPVGVIIESMFE